MLTLQDLYKRRPAMPRIIAGRRCSIAIMVSYAGLKYR